MIIDLVFITIEAAIIGFIGWTYLLELKMYLGLDKEEKKGKG